MITQKAMQNRAVESKDHEAVREAMRLLQQTTGRPQIQQWVCEVCGMVHPGNAPDACDSCGATAITRQTQATFEMNSRW